MFQKRMFPREKQLLKKLDPGDVYSCVVKVESDKLQLICSAHSSILFIQIMI